MSADSSETPSKRRFPLRFFTVSLFLAAAGSAGVYSVDQLLVGPQQARERQLESELKIEREQKAKLKKRAEELEKRAKELKNFVDRLKHTERRAQIVVLDQQVTPDGQKTTKIRFTEINDKGDPISKSRDFTLPGEEIYFDCLVAPFDDSFIEQGHALKGKAIILFRRIYSDKLRPLDGYVLDHQGVAPLLYASQNAATPLEAEIWKSFWDLANDPEAAKKKGLRSPHGKALYTKLVKNKVYHIEVRSTGGMFIGAPGTLKK